MSMSTVLSALSIANTTPTEPGIEGFLQDLGKNTRRACLAQHQLYCHEERKQHDQIEYEKEELAQTEINTSLLTEDQLIDYEKRIAGLHRKNRPHRKRSLNEKEDELKDNTSPNQIQADDTMSAGQAALDIPTGSSSLPHKKTTTDMTTSIREIRTSIYEKYVNTFQAFYNDHDAMSILSMLMYPCCSPTINREMNIWVSMTIPECHSVTLPNGNISEGYLLKKHMHRLKSRQFIGREAFHQDCAQILNKLPDCIIVCDNIKVKRPLTNNDYTIVSSDYSYFFTVPIRLDQPCNNINPISAVTRMPPPIDSSNLLMIQVEVMGCNILYFNNNGIIEKEIDHVALKSVSDPNASVLQILSFLDM